MLFKYQGEYGAAYTGGNHVRQRLGVESRLRAPEDRQNQGEHHKAALTEQRQHQRSFGAGQSGEAVHPGVLHRQRDDGQGEYPQPPGGQINQGGIGGEDPHHPAGHQLEYHKQNGGEAQAHPQHAAGGLPHPVTLAGAIVVTDDGLGAAADAKHRAGDQSHTALYDGGAGDQKVTLLRAAVPLQHRVHGNQDQAVGGHDQKRRKTNGRHPQHKASVRAGEPDADGRLAEQEPHGKAAA